VHVSCGHGLSAEEYRERFGLNRETALASPAYLRWQAEVQRPHLARVRPAVNPVTSAPPEQQAEWKSRQSHRREARRRISEARKQFNAERPKPKKARPPRLPKTEAHKPGLRRVAELMRDPAWHAAWNAKQAASRRTLSDQQIQEITALKGREQQATVARRCGTTPGTVRRIWRGLIAPLTNVS
jgi:hypothetical protein